MPTMPSTARIVRKPRAMVRPMVTVWNEDDEIAVPDWVRNINSFRRWLDLESVPEKRKIWWLQGEVWIDMNKEQLYSHNRLRTTVTSKLFTFTEKEDLGVFFSDGVLLSNIGADISGNPDGVYVSHEAFRTKRVTQIEGKQRGYVELVGVADMVLEILSDSSVIKDTERLFAAYALAGIREYWLIDARGEHLRFDINRLTVKGYVAGRKQDGWIKSSVFARSFRLTESHDLSGNPKYRLEMR